MTDHKLSVARITVETLIAEAQTARVAARVAAHIRIVLAQLKSRA